MDKKKKSPYKYQEWINDAFLEVTKKIIKTIEKEGLYKDLHFFITFNTEHPLVQLPAFLKAKYPKTMTIVLQNQFFNLKCEVKGFRVTLIFSGIETELFIPWNSITQLLDPVSPISLTIKKLDLKETDSNKNNKIIKFPKI